MIAKVLRRSMRPRVLIRVITRELEALSLRLKEEGVSEIVCKSGARDKQIRFNVLAAQFGGVFASGERENIPSVFGGNNR